MGHGEAKKRSKRIPLDYYKTPDKFQARKRYFLIAVTVGSLAIVAAALFSYAGQGAASPGPLIAAHSAFDDDCEACHAPYQPIAGATWTAALGINPHNSSQRCAECHKDVGAHHCLLGQQGEPSCASCHQDHRGRQASLVQSEDFQCTQCHDDIASHIATDLPPGCVPPGDLVNVTGFSASPDDHPQFALFRNGTPVDPGGLKFNHAQHMTAGIAPAADAKPLLLAEQLSSADRAKLKLNETGPAQLQCASCHSAGDNRGRGASTNGRYMQPVTFEQNCSSCHPLTFDTAAPEAQVPHGLATSEVSDWLWRYFAAKYFREEPELLEEEADWRGRLNPPQDQARMNTRQALQQQVDLSQRLLYAEKRACGECHQYAAGSPVGDVAPVIAATQVPTVWYSGAQFDHSAHRTYDCRECHEQAYADSATASVSNVDVMLPKLEDCAKCHAPVSRSGDQTLGGARYDCAECHHYHGAGPISEFVQAPTDHKNMAAIADKLLQAQRPAPQSIFAETLLTPGRAFP